MPDTLCHEVFLQGLQRTYNTVWALSIFPGLVLSGALLAVSLTEPHYTYAWVSIQPDTGPLFCRSLDLSLVQIALTFWDADLHMLAALNSLIPISISFQWVLILCCSPVTVSTKQACWHKGYLVFSFQGSRTYITWCPVGKSCFFWSPFHSKLCYHYFTKSSQYPRRQTFKYGGPEWWSGNFLEGQLPRCEVSLDCQRDKSWRVTGWWGCYFINGLIYW